MVWLLGALVAGAAAAIAALLYGRAVPVAVLCWVVAGPGAIGLLAVHALHETRARTRPLYIRPAWLTPLYVVVVVVVVLGIATSAWRIADWWGRT